MKRLLLFTSAMVPLFLPQPAWAHALGAQWSIQGDKVLVEAYFSDNTKPQGALVRVLRENDRARPILEEKTDVEGGCSFRIPQPGKYIIVVDAGAGHRTELPMEIPSALIFDITLAWGSASLCGIDNLSMVPILARSMPAPPTDREKFTSYPWRPVILIISGLLAIAVFFWVRNG